MNLSAPQVPSSRAKPRDLYCTTAICTHAPSLKRHLGASLVLPFSPFPHPRFTGLQERSLHFGPHDTQERQIVSYCFSYRCVELCLFEALYPAPSARPFSKGLLVSLLRLVTRDLNTTFGHRPIKKGGAQVLSQAAQMRLSFSYTTSCLLHLSTKIGHETKKIRHKN